VPAPRVHVRRVQEDLLWSEVAAILDIPVGIATS
jgi:hypothetical protein